MAQMPVDPRLSRMLIEGQKQKCLDEMVIISSALSIMDPRERPLENAQAADTAHETFKDPLSDFFTLLNMWHQCRRIQFQAKTNSAARKFCKEHYLLVFLN